MEAVMVSISISDLPAQIQQAISGTRVAYCQVSRDQRGVARYYVTTEAGAVLVFDEVGGVWTHIRTY
jgi:hypothetical protein